MPSALRGFSVPLSSTGLKALSSAGIADQKKPGIALGDTGRQRLKQGLQVLFNTILGDLKQCRQSNAAMF